jgi:signal transduction histidine kinase/DNA-binding response OmpR family regulator
MTVEMRQPAAQPEANRYAVLRGQSILMVEPTPGAFAPWKQALEQVGMEVHCVCGSLPAIAQIAETAGERLDFALVSDSVQDGPSLAVIERLSVLRPSPEVVLVGDPRNQERVIASWRARVALLPEPRTGEELLGMILEMQRRRAPLSTVPPAPHPLVLVVEDSPAATGLIRDTLDGEYRIETASDGYMGFRKAMQLIPDVIITDLNMPRLDGSQLLRLLRSRPDLHHIPVVLLTANGDESLRMRALSEGAQDYLVKPFSAQELRARIGNLASLARSRALLQTEVADNHRRLDDVVGQLMLQKRHAVFLSEASKLLGSSIEYRTTIKQVTRLYVAHVADAALVDLVDEQGQLQSLALACAEPSLERELLNVRAGNVPRIGEPHPLVGSVRAGETIVFQRAPGLLDRLCVHSGMSVPLIARDKQIGAITAWSTIAPRPFGPLEQALTEDLARRLAFTIDHAGLYHDATHAVAARDEFLSVASHELKTPLNPLQLQVQSLLRRTDQILVAEHKDKVKAQLDSIYRQTEKLTRLVNDLLDLSRISGGRIEFELESMDLTAVVRDVVKLFEEREEITRFRCTLSCDYSDGLIGQYDQFRLEQIVTNLLSNALKYGAGTPVTVTTRRNGDHAELSVSDQGIGIAPVDQKRIFLRFERAVTAKNFGGLGLGLFIVSQLVEGMGGSIGVTSTRRADDAANVNADEPRLTTFTVKLPLSAAG